MLEMITAVVSTVCLVASLLLRFTPFTPIMTRQERRRLLPSYVMACLLNVGALYGWFRTNGISMDVIKHDILVFALVTELINIFVIHNRPREHMFVFGIVVTCNSILTSVPIYFANLLFFEDINTRRIWTTVLFVVLMIVTYYPIRILLKKTVEPFLMLEDDDDYWKTVWFIPVGMCLAMYFAFPGNVDEVTGASILSRCLTGASLVFLSMSVAKNHGRIREKQFAETMLNDQRVYYAGMQQRVEEVRKARHDFKHYMAAVQRFVEMDDKEGLREYCYKLEEQHNQEVMIPYTGNTAVDGVLYRYMQLCRENGVCISYAGRIKSQGITDIDLCVLLGNALDNAFEGSVTAKAPEIKVVAQSEDNVLSIMVRNTYDGILKMEDTMLLSKKRKCGTGIGLVSMKAVCDKYGGTMQTVWDQHTFTVMFVLPVK